MAESKPKRRARWRAAVAGAVAASLAGALAACAVPSPGEDEPWPPRLRPAEERIGVAPTPAERRERSLRESGVTVLRDTPYH